MADLVLEVPHTLSIDDAARRLKAIVADGVVEDPALRDIRFGFKDDALLFTGKVKGFAVSGYFRPRRGVIQGKVRFPWAAKPFQESAIARIHAFFAARFAADNGAQA